MSVLSIHVESNGFAICMHILFIKQESRTLSLVDVFIYLYLSHGYIFCIYIRLQSFKWKIVIILNNINLDINLEGLNIH